MATRCEFTGSARDFLPETLSLPVLRSAAQGCRGCDLYCHATQAVFGEGPLHATAMFVGEQPGDQEDKAGKPFVGPAGGMLNGAMEQAGIDRSTAYVTNTVKHFRFEQRGKKRLHAKPSARQISACLPWLEAEIAVVKPKVLVCLGATAARALLGKDFRVSKDRGIVIRDSAWAPAVVATVHPSSLLRIPDHEGRQAAYAAFVSDLKVVASEIARVSRPQADASANRRQKELFPGREAGEPKSRDESIPSRRKSRATRRP